MGYRRGGGVAVTLAERLARNSEPEPMSGCVLWDGVIMPNGYGRMVIWDPETKTYSGHLAHRVSYREVKGEIPPGLDLDHLCRVRRCINAAHLEPVTRSVNVRRGALPGMRAAIARRIAAQSTACKRGHPWTAETTYRSPGSPDRRECRRCHADAQTRRLQRRSA